MFKCSQCMYVHWLEEVPEICPKCMATGTFASVIGKDKDLIEKSLYGNELLIEMADTLNKVIDIANDGIKEHADEACADMYSRIYKSSIEMVQMIKAELEMHIKNGRWG